MLRAAGGSRARERSSPGDDVPRATAMVWLCRKDGMMVAMSHALARKCRFAVEETAHE
jgi:hypothetical protein